LNTFIARNYIVQAFEIPAGSMKPTMLIGDHILASKYIYFFSEPKRGDIVIFPFPEEPSKNFIKRIVGIGGDIIEIRNKQVFINNELHREIYTINQDSRILPKNVQPRDNFGPTKIPEDSLFVMGDNRDHSYDSRFWGFVKKSSVKGKAVSIYWSFDKGQDSVRWDRVGKNIQ
jgi:signal peptidase I